jgi:hypothetical protein
MDCVCVLSTTYSVGPNRWCCSLSPNTSNNMSRVQPEGNRISTSCFKYKESSIISGTGAAIKSKTNFGPIGHHQARSSPLLRMCKFPALLPFLNASWKPCSVRVFSTDCNSLSISSTESKWWPFSFIFNRINRENKVGGGGQSFCCWSNIHWWK